MGMLLHPDGLSTEAKLPSGVGVLLVDIERKSNSRVGCKSSDRNAESEAVETKTRHTRNCQPSSGGTQNDQNQNRGHGKPPTMRNGGAQTDPRKMC